MTGNPTNVAELNRPHFEDMDVANLFSIQSNSEIFQQLLDEPGIPRIAELTAVYFLRPTYINGSPAHQKLEPGHPLREAISELDLDRFTDPVEKHAFSMLQAVIEHEDAGNELQASMLDQQTTGALLVPGLLKKYGPKTSFQILSKFGDYFQYNDSTLAGDVFGETLYTVGEGVALTEPANEGEAFDRLRLVQRAAYISKKYAERIDEKYEKVDLPNNPISEEFKVLDQQLQMLVRLTCERDLKLEPQVADTVMGAFQDETFARAIVKNETSFAQHVQLFEDPDVQEMVAELFKPTQLRTDVFQADIFKKAFDQKDPLAFLKEFKLVLADESFSVNLDLLARNDFKSMFLRAIQSSENPLEYSREIMVILQSDEFKPPDDPILAAQFKSYLLGSLNPSEYLADFNESMTKFEEHGVFEKLATMTDDQDTPANQLKTFVIAQPEMCKRIIDTLQADGRLSRLLNEPSQALTKFMYLISQSGVDLEMLGPAASAVMLDNYIPASRAKNRDQRQYYLDNVSNFLADIHSLQGEPQVWEAYKDFIETSGITSVKDQTRAVRIFNALRKFGMPDLDGSETLDEIEKSLVDNFIKRLTDSENVLSDEHRARLLENFGSVAPLLTYTQRFINEPAYKTALSELTLSVSDGTYSTWRRGDGSPESFTELVSSGYLPENLTQSQYEEWITDGSMSSMEELASSAEDTAQAIRSNLELASVDMAIIAPGYTLQAESLSVLDEDRKALGQILGLLGQLSKSSVLEDFNLDSNTALQEIMSNTTSPAAHSLAGSLSAVSSVQEAKKLVSDARIQLDQLRLLVRVANITSEEVARGALLSDSGADGVRKVQQSLPDAIEKLKQSLPDSLQFIPDSVEVFLRDFSTESEGIEEFTVEDTIDPKTTLEIGEVPLRSCQHYESGAYNAGLIGYFGPEVKILAVRNEKGGIVARSILRLMEGEKGQPLLYAEPVYTSVANPKITELLRGHLLSKAEAMGVPAVGFLGNQKGVKSITTKKLKMPAVYSDSGGGINSGSLSINLH